MVNVEIPNVNVKIPVVDVSWSNILLWIVVLTGFGIMIVALILSSSPNDNKIFDENISDSTMSYIANQLSTNYGLATISDGFLTGITGVKFTNNVLMETGDSCSFRFNVDDCDDANCEMVENPAGIFNQKPELSKFTFQAQGSLTDTFMFPIPGNRTYIMKTNDDDTNQVAGFFY